MSVCVLYAGQGGGQGGAYMWRDMREGGWESRKEGKRRSGVRKSGC